MSYFLIYQHDKEARVKQVTKKEIKEILDEEEAIFIKPKIEDTDPAYWGENAYLLIKGEVIVPKPKKVVTEYEIE